MVKTNLVKIDEVLPQAPDPDDGEIRERKFVPAKEVNNYLKWGPTGEAIFDQANAIYKKHHS